VIEPDVHRDDDLRYERHLESLYGAAYEEAYPPYDPDDEEEADEE